MSKDDLPFSFKTQILIAGIIIVTCVVVFFLWTFFAPRHFPWEGEAERAKILSQLPQARAQWEAQNLLNHDVDVHRYSMFSPCWPWLSLQVREGKVTKVVAHSDFDIKSNQFAGTTRVLVPDDGGYCDADQLTPQGVFDEVEQRLNNLDPTEVYVSVNFNKKYGFVEEYRMEYNNQGIDHWLSGLTFTNFQPISTTPAPVGN